ncbi:MAG TPA: FtsX-like permease family protein [Candidatus Binatia bacterium]|nr:FtsX-like permease family protein [Candidatus Binatia bacterium]
MRIRDRIIISQRNLLRSKLRTFLTISAVLIGTFTISLTNGVGNGIKSYVDRELGNVGAENTLIIQPRNDSDNPVSSDVQEYDPDRQLGMFNQTLLGPDDIREVQQIRGVDKVIPELNVQVEYLGVGEKKFQATVGQYIENFNIQLQSGSYLDLNRKDMIMIPMRYVDPLGLGSAEEAIGKNITLGYKDVNGRIVEKELIIAAVTAQSLLGSATSYISNGLLMDINNDQTRGVAGLSERYPALVVSHDPAYSDEEVESLKQIFSANGYNAQTIQDAIGTINTVINGILIVLNVFGIIALLAATFGIVNTLLMAVTERTSEIGLMKALGANRTTIFSIFAMEAASIGFWGALLGIGISMILAPIVNNIATNNFLQDFVGFKLLAFPFLPSLGIFLGIILLAFLAGTLPSIKASKQDPISALRYE